jgi:acyl-coenzyme A thioesterase PaaI-like protein
VDLDVKMLKPVPAGVVLQAEARVLHCTRRLGVADALLKDEQGCVYAQGTASCLISRAPRQDETAAPGHRSRRWTPTADRIN